MLLNERQPGPHLPGLARARYFDPRSRPTVRHEATPKTIGSLERRPWCRARRRGEESEPGRVWSPETRHSLESELVDSIKRDARKAEGGRRGVAVLSCSRYPKQVRTVPLRDTSHVRHTSKVHRHKNFADLLFAFAEEMYAVVRVIVLYSTAASTTPSKF